MPLSPGDRLGPYECISLLGKGGMGEVYKAHDTRLKRDVAIKTSSKQFSERFEREARAIAALNHPNICTLYDVGPNYLVMEYVEGAPLKGPVPLDEALGYARQITSALEAAHDKAITHRDLKPGNIMLKPDGTIKVLDFGLAKFGGPQPTSISEDSPTLSMAATQAGTVLGTAAYMSPEQARGKEVDKRADIWAFGVVLHELLTGKRLFKGEDLTETLAAVVMREPDFSEVPHEVRRLLKRCLQKDPAKRLRDIGDAWELLDAPEKVLEPVTVVQQAPPSKLPWLVTAAVAIGAAAFVFWPKPAPDLQALRYTIDAPPGFRLDSIFAAGTPSPDGRFIVFSAIGSADSSKGQNGMSQLWLRPTDSLEARPLPGTEGGNFPFWSPDGKSIGFFADRKVQRIEVVGGAPQVLCTAPNFEGGTWSKDGVLLFSSNARIWRVAAGGGKSERITKREGQQENHRDPQFLPDGQTFLYRAVSPDEKVTGIYAATLANPDAPVLLVAGTDRKAAYAPPIVAGRPGYLLWVRGQTLVAQRFDAAGLKLEGDAVPVADELLLQPGTGARRAAYWISQNGLLAYRTGSAPTTGRQMTWISRDGKQREPVGKPDDFYEQFRLSPDGKQVALSRTVSGNEDIWLYEFARGVMSRLTFDPAAERSPVWSPDGRQVAYASNRAGLFQLFRKDAGAGQEERLHESTLPEEPKDWSRDGKFLLYGSDDPKTGADQWVLSMGGTAPRKAVPVLQTPFDESRTRISPDGKWVAYASNEAGSGNGQIFIRATPGGPPGQWQVSNAGGDQPRWRADGKELFFHSNGGQAVWAAGIKLLADRVNIEAPRELFTYEGANPAYEPTSDGQRFLVLSRPPDASDGEAGAGALKIVSNWQALLK